MGIWFEPEMVNEDSDLYREHPDWILKVEGTQPVPSRYQHALDVVRSEVADYLYEKINAILTEYDIRYVKWDMNQDLHHPGGELGQPVAFSQVHAIYRLIDRIRTAHPLVEIESCS